MADFITALTHALKFEGEYSNDSSDKGGETFRGISRVNWPLWSGWPIIDALRDHDDFPRVLGNIPSLGLATTAFYNEKFWRYGNVGDQDVANFIFDCAVNHGSPAAHKLVQRALLECGRNIATDGEWGKQTEDATNSVAPVKLLVELRLQRLLRYARIVMNDKSQEKFLKGWVRRALVA